MRKPPMRAPPLPSRPKGRPILIGATTAPSREAVGGTDGEGRTDQPDGNCEFGPPTLGTNPPPPLLPVEAWVERSSSSSSSGRSMRKTTGGRAQAASDGKSRLSPPSPVSASESLYSLPEKSADSASEKSLQSVSLP